MAIPNETITISQFKATCLAVLVTRRGEPIAVIDPPPLPKKKASWLGSFALKGAITGDIVSPVLPESDWEVLND